MPSAAASFFLPALLLYRFYFRVETFDIDRVPEGDVGVDRVETVLLL